VGTRFGAVKDHARASSIATGRIARVCDPGDFKKNKQILKELKDQSR
jgi:hypothetical protein